MIAYFNGTFLPKSDIAISPDDRGFLLADGLYEVIRSYQGNLFMPEEHIERLNYGARHLRLETTDFTYLVEVAKELLKKNGLQQQDATVYLQVTRGASKRSHCFPDKDTPLTVYATASAFNNPVIQKGMEEGVDVITLADQRWARCDLKTVALTANVLANQQAHEAGVSEAIFIRDGALLEGTHSNFMCVFDDVVVTAPATNYILNGITRQAILAICKELGISVEQRPIFTTEIEKATEAMVIGTTLEITPVVKIDEIAVGSGSPGPITTTLQKAFQTKIAG